MIEMMNKNVAGFLYNIMRGWNMDEQFIEELLPATMDPELVITSPSLQKPQRKRRSLWRKKRCSSWIMIIRIKPFMRSLAHMKVLQARQCFRWGKRQAGSRRMQQRQGRRS